MVTIRVLSLPDDIPAITSLDTSFETDVIYHVALSQIGAQLIELSAHWSKRYIIEMNELARLSSAQPGLALAAEVGGKLVGLAAAEYVEWNRRVILHDLYVSRAFRGTGIGALLLSRTVDWSRGTPARCIWLETQNVNYPAIQFYRRFGFSLCGFDARLYDPENTDPTEVGLFFSLDLIRTGIISSI